MFRSKRSGLIKRLWKARVRQDETGGQAQTASSTAVRQAQTATTGAAYTGRCCICAQKVQSGSAPHLGAPVTAPLTAAQEEQELKAAMNSLLKRLKDPQLQALVAAVESRGASPEGDEACVLLPPGPLQCGRRSVQPHVLAAQLWRFPDLHSSTVSHSNQTCCHNNHVRGHSNGSVDTSNTCGCHGDRTNNGLTLSNCGGCYGDHRLIPLPCCGNSSNNNNSCCHGNDSSNSTTSRTTPPGPALPQVCINPFHWSRVVEPDLPPPPYSSTLSEKDTGNGLTEVSHDLETPVSTETGGTLRHDVTGDGGSVPWCHVAYWELRRRVGRLYSVFDSSVNIFEQLPHPPGGGGLCLAVLHESGGVGGVQTDGGGGAGQNIPTSTLKDHAPFPPDAPPNNAPRGSRNISEHAHRNRNSAQDAISRTRDKIGLGVTLWRDASDNDDPGGVWAYNRSGAALFINTPMLDAHTPTHRTFSVVKVPPGYSMKIFDYSSGNRTDARVPDPPDPPDGPYDPNSIRISFAKGWGPSYSRQFITSCPCWLEVLLTVTR